jgi:hypothetical protein
MAALAQEAKALPADGQPRGVRQQAFAEPAVARKKHADEGAEDIAKQALQRSWRSGKRHEIFSRFAITYQFDE